MALLSSYTRLYRSIGFLFPTVCAQGSPHPAIAINLSLSKIGTRGTTVLNGNLRITAGKGQDINEPTSPIMDTTSDAILLNSALLQRRQSDNATQALLDDLQNPFQTEVRLHMAPGGLCWAQ